MIKVTCAIVQHKQRILVVQRSETMHLPNKWEFPGGKIEDGETEVECIMREIKEELNIDISLAAMLTPTTFHYPTVAIQLIPFLANFEGGILKLAEHKSYKWVPKEELSELDWADADIPILKEYLSL